MKEIKYEHDAMSLLRSSNSALLSTISVSKKDYPFFGNGIWTGFNA